MMILGHSERQLDDLWRKLIYMIHGGHCAKCGSVYRLSAHHLIKRRYRITRFDTSGGILLCWRCHDDAEHPERPEFDKWLTLAKPEMKKWQQEHWLGRHKIPTQPQLEEQATKLIELYEKFCQSTMTAAWERKPREGR